MIHINSSEVNIKGRVQPFEWTVSPEGKFQTEINGVQFESDTLYSLSSNVRDYLVSERTEVPFTSSIDGREGVMRGYHAAQNDILVTWSNGDKGKISTHTGVFTPDMIDDSTAEEIRTLNTTIQNAQQRLQDIRKQSLHARTVLDAALGAPLVSSHGLEHDEAAALLSR